MRLGILKITSIAVAIEAVFLFVCVMYAYVEVININVVCVHP
jgi:hypothetical protein